MTKPADLRGKTADEREALLGDLRREQFNLRFQRATGQTEATARAKQVRRDIARVKTIQAELTRRSTPTAAPVRPSTQQS